MITARSLALVALVGAAPVSPVRSAPVTDPRTGLSVDPPAGYEVSNKAPLPRESVAFQVSRLGEGEATCGIGFEEREPNELTLEQFNRVLAKPDRKRTLRQTLGKKFQVISLDIAEISGVLASIAVVDPKPGFWGNGEKPPFRTMLAGFSTPKGMTVALCSAPRGSFAAHKKDFGAIIRSVVAPR